MKLGQRIAYQQAKIILISSFLIGICSAVAQYYIDLQNVRQALLESIDRSIAIYEPNIQQAVFNLDSSQAEGIANILVKDPLFTAATIYDDFGDLMVDTSRAERLERSWLGQISFRLLNIPERFERRLQIMKDNDSKARLDVVLDTQFVSQGLENRAITLGLSNLIATILLSSLLFIVFYFALSKPIQRISQWVAQLDQDQADTNLPYTKPNELGDLTRNVHDIWSKKDEANRQVMQLAYYDPLTELANRRMFIEHLDRSLKSAEKTGSIGAVMYLDIDRFKTINDSLGHHVGDRLLVTIAERLKRILPANATVARFGGDEFVLLLPDLNRNKEIAAEKAMQIASSIIETVATPAAIGRNLIHCSTSIGLTVYPLLTDNSGDILRRADTALYRVKGEGRNSYQFYDEGMQKRAKARWEIEEGLHKAIEGKELEVWLQPQVSSSAVITGAEVLLRWRHPEKGMIQPMDFISVAEESGQISNIEEWVLEESLRLLTQWQEAGLPQTFKHLSINISPAHFMQVDFVARILNLLDRYRIKGIKIEFEITENLLIDNFKHASDTMYSLQKHGISFAIDDFGTGYSSLHYLSQLPLNILKIDRSFVSRIEHSDDDAAIIDVILITAEKLGLEVIAEGVETLAQRQLLLGRGCHLYQGFYFSRPRPHQDFYQFLIQNDGHITSTGESSEQATI